MKNLTLLTGSVVTCLATALQVSASIVPTPITSPNPDYQSVASSTQVLHDPNDVAKNSSLVDSISGTFNITTAGTPNSITIASANSAWAGLGAGTTYTDEVGFNPASQQVTSGTIYLWIKGTDGAAISFSVNLGGFTTSTTPGSFPAVGGPKVTYNFADGTLASGEISLLDVNGQLKYTISDTGTGSDADFTVDYAVLQVATTPVPEPTTVIAGALLLLPFGFSALRTLGKKRAA